MLAARRPLLLAIALLLPLSSASDARAAGEVAAGEPAPATAAAGWDWGAPVTFEVRTHKADEHGRLVFVETYELLPAGGDFALRTVDAKLLEHEHARMSREQLEALMRGVLAVDPRLIVGSDAAPKSLTKQDKAGAELATLAASITEDPAARRMLEGFLSSPALADQLFADQADIWNGWVGYWAGQALPPGEAAELEAPDPSGAGQVTLAIRNHGPDPERSGTVRWTATLTPDPDALRAAAQPIWNAVAAQFPPEAKEQFAAALQQATFSLSSSVEAWLDPAGLRPAFVVREKTTVWTFPGIPEQRSVKRSEYAFSWK